MPVCLITNLPDGGMATRYYDDGIRPEKRSKPEVKRFAVYGPLCHLVYCSGRFRALRTGLHGFTPEAIARYKDEANAIDEKDFI
jgi:hypothetical protein